MSTKATATPNTVQESRSAWSAGDTSDAGGAHENLIRETAKQLSAANEKTYGGGQSEQSPTISNSENQQATEPNQTTVAPVSLFPRDSLFPDKPSTRTREATFIPLQEWEGYVLDVGKDTFTARLVDVIADGEQEEEEADFPIAELSDADQRDLQPGAILRWALGYRRTRGGSKERVSRVIFRRLPAWTERELKENRCKAEALAAALQGE